MNGDRQGGRWRRGAVVVAVCAAWLGTVGGLVLASAAAGPGGGGGVLRSRPCDLGALPVAAECFALTVPERREDPGARPIELFGVTLRSTNPVPDATSVLYLEGGPGEAASASVAEWAESPILAERDLILLDQRGTGRSNPLRCPEVEIAFRDAFVATGRAPADELAAARAAARSCADRLRAEGADLDGYSTAETAADVADLRRALGVESWTLYGVSYGTRAALGVLRDHPEGVGGAVLDSVAPFDVIETDLPVLAANLDRARDHFFADCAADAVCDAGYPDLDDTYDVMVTRYNDAPYRTDVDLGPERGGIATLEITGDDLVAVVLLALKEQSLIPSLPAIIAALAGGDVAPLDELVVPLVVDGVLRPDGTFHGSQYAVDCADLPPRATAANAALVADPGSLATVLLFASGAYCDVWDVAPADPTANQPVRSEVPALFLAGAFDPVTLPAQTERAAGFFADATLVEIPDAGHGPSRSSACAGSLVLAFLTDPDAGVDAGCAAALDGPAFLVPEGS